jgi:hypothetical protein
LSQIHASEFKYLFLSWVVFALELQKIALWVEYNCEFLIMSISPLDHYDQIVFSWLKFLFENDVLLIVVSTSNPAEPSIVFFLQKNPANPQILIDTALVIESILLLPDIKTDTCLFKDSEGTKRSCVIWRNLNLLNSFFFLLFFRSFFDTFWRIDRTCRWVRIGSIRKQINCCKNCW